jgi:hypothetical protein
MVIIQWKSSFKFQADYLMDDLISVNMKHVESNITKDTVGFKRGRWTTKASYERSLKKSIIYCSLLLDIPEITIQIVLHIFRQNSFHINDHVNPHKCLIWGTQQSYEY